MKITCVNEYGKEINYAVAENLMDDVLREEIHRELAPCSEQEFLTSTQNGTRRSSARFGS